MKLLETQYAKVKEWWRPGTGTVSMWDLTMARLQVKLLTGLTSTLFLGEQAMSKIRSAAYVTQSRARETIALHNISKIKVTLPTAQSGQVLSYNSGSYSWNHPGLGNGPSVYSTQWTASHSVTFNTQANKPVLIITKDGDVEWHGKPSDAADCLVRTFQFAVEEKKGVTKAARRRYYYRACKNLLNKAEKMKHEEFVDFLQKQVYTRERTVILDGLKNE